MFAEVNVSIVWWRYCPNSDPTYIGPKNCVWQVAGKPELMLYTKFEVSSFNGCRNK